MGCAPASSSKASSAEEVPDGEYDPPSLDTVFTSLHTAMEVTHRLEPMHHPDHVPLVLTVLLRRIEEKGGFQTEGIFRVNGTKLVVDKIRAEIIAEHYSVVSENEDEITVHDLASTFKQWLGSLDDSLIPLRFYNEAMRMGQEPFRITKQSLKDLLKRFPIENQQCIKYIVHYMRRLTEEDNVSVNLMPVRNIATVFGPHLLRSPDMQDPLKLVQNARYEQEFIQGLLTKLEVESGFSLSKSTIETHTHTDTIDAIEQAGETHTLEKEKEENIDEEQEELLNTTEDEPPPYTETEDGGSSM